MQRWEYLDVRWVSSDAWEVNGQQVSLGDPVGHERLNRWGSEGWELVIATFDSHGAINRYLFKRPKE